MTAALVDSAAAVAACLSVEAPPFVPAHLRTLFDAAPSAFFAARDPFRALLAGCLPAPPSHSRTTVTLQPHQTPNHPESLRFPVHQTCGSQPGKCDSSETRPSTAIEACRTLLKFCIEALIN